MMRPPPSSALFPYTTLFSSNGPDSFTYKANDGLLDSNVATVALAINPVNDAPLAVNDSFATDEDTVLTITAPGVLGNDTDIDSPTLTAVVVTGPSHGTLTLDADGGFTYTPAANFNGSDSFTYKANDGQVDSNVATEALTLNPRNDAPVAVNDSFATNEDTALTITAARKSTRLNSSHLAVSYAVFCLKTSYRTLSR